MTALVTGGGGFLGLYLVEQLRDRGEQVRVLCRGEYPRLRELNVDIHRGDLRDPRAVADACRGIDTVFHTAAIPGIWGPRDLFMDINLRGTRHVIDACQQAGVRKLIYTSSPSVVFDGASHRNADESLPYASTFLCHYPESKALAEQEVRAAHEPGRLLTVALRPHLIWGPRDNHLIPRLIARARSGRLRRVGDGQNRISMAYVENAAAAHWQAADTLSDTAPHGGQAYFINEPEAVNLWDWINELLSRANLPPIRKSISAPAAWRIGRTCETLWKTFRLPGEPPMTRFLALQLSQSHTYSIAAAQRDFGYRPLVDTEEGLRRLQPDLLRLATERS